MCRNKVDTVLLAVSPHIDVGEKRAPTIGDTMGNGLHDRRFVGFVGIQVDLYDTFVPGYAIHIVDSRYRQIEESGDIDDPVVDIIDSNPVETHECVRVRSVLLLVLAQSR